MVVLVICDIKLLLLQYYIIYVTYITTFTAIHTYFLVYLYIYIYIYLGRFIRKSAQTTFYNKADKNMNTRRLCGKNNITNKKYLIYTAKRSHNRKKK